jgi:hypothetical protein
MLHAHAMEVGLGHVAALRALLAAALCVATLAVLCAGALMNIAGPQTGPASEAVGGTIAAPAAAGQSAAQDENDIAVQPRVDGIGIRHAFRKPRRSNRRLRVPGRGIAHSGSARAGTHERGMTQLTLKRKHTSKRALMRRLMTVRGGLQA